MADKTKNFKDLKIWQLGIDIVVCIYNISKVFPKDEAYGLASQMKRAAVSIPSNIAEGFKRKHKTEYRQYLHIALGSTAELETQVIIAEKVKYIDYVQLNDILEMLDHESKMITNLIKCIEN